MNKAKKLTGYLIDTKTAEAKPVTINQTLEDYYTLLDCDLITVTYRFIGGKEFCIIADDEGLFKTEPIVSAFSVANGAELVGSLFIVSAECDEEGNFISISKEDEKLISDNIFGLFLKDSIQPMVLIA